MCSEIALGRPAEHAFRSVRAAKGMRGHMRQLLRNLGVQTYSNGFQNRASTRNSGRAIAMLTLSVCNMEHLEPTYLKSLAEWRTSGNRADAERQDPRDVAVRSKALLALVGRHHSRSVLLIREVGCVYTGRWNGH